MAEVSLRLLRSKARQHLLEETIPCGRKHGGSLVPPYLVLSDCTGEIGPRLRLYSVWPSGARTVDPQLSSRAAVRLYSQWARSRFSQRQNGAGGAQDVDSPLYRSRTAYYDILEVTRNATQAQIKAAYYKQTFRFHPDRNSGNQDAGRHFGVVMEAYNVLGNISLRKKYDSGILSLQDVRSAKKPSGKDGSPTRKEARGARGTTASSTTPSKPMFDFDAFYQAHYGEQLAREQLWKAQREQKERREREKNLSNSINGMSDLTTLLILFSAVTVFILMR